MTVNGNGSSTILIEDAATYNVRTGSSIAADHVLISINGTLVIDAVNIEALNLYANTGDTVTINGDFSASTLSSQPFIFDATENPTLNLGGITSNHGVAYISGSTGNDILNGGNSNDILLGQGGDDTINGGTGSDILHGDRTILHDENFEIGAIGWTDSSTENGGNLLTNFLGRFANINGGIITSKTFDIPNVDEISLTFDVYEIDSWDNENFTVYIDGNAVFTTNWHHNSDDESYSGSSGNYNWEVTPGYRDNYGFNSWDEQIHHVTITIANPGSTLELGFQTNINESLSNESFGIDNLKLFVSDPAPSDGNDILNGGSGDDIIYGDGGNDTINYNVGDGVDTVDGGDDTDTLNINGDGTDTYLIEDAATYNARTGGFIEADHFLVSINGSLAINAVNIETVNLNLDTGDSLTINGDFDNTTLSSQPFILDGSQSPIVDISGIVSDHGVINISGTASADTILAGSGNDEINAGDGDDIISGDVLYRENFENGATGWTDNTTTSGGSFFTNFLGRFSGSGGAESISKTFELPDTDQIIITFDVYEIDSWDNEDFNVFIDGTEIFNTNWRHTSSDENSSGSSGDISWDVTRNAKGVMGFTSKWTDQTHTFSITIDNPGDSVQLGFGSAIGVSLGDESWGLDNLVITSSNSGNDTINAEGGDDTNFWRWWR